MDELTVVTWRSPRVSAIILESVTFPETERNNVLMKLKEACGARELCYVATCQRVVFALLAPDSIEPLAGLAHGGDQEAPRAPETFRGRDAFHHLAEVASSLDSLVPGEPQVLGQMKAGVAQSRAMEVSGPHLDHAFSHVFRAAKAVRRETELFRGKVSVLPLLDEELERWLGAKEDARAAVLGTGRLGLAVAGRLRKSFPAADLVLVSRSQGRATAAAAAGECEPADLAGFLSSPPRVDVVVCAMASDAPVLMDDEIQRIARGHALLVIDLAMPRNAGLIGPPPAGVKLLQMDELARLSAINATHRERELEPARTILARELARTEAEYAERASAHILAMLTSRFDAVRDERRDVAPAQSRSDPAFDKWLDQTVRALLHESARAVKEAGCPKKS